MKKELTRFEMAAIKRTAQNVKGMRAKKLKICTKLEELTNQLETINNAIDAWEAPIKALTGGYTSEEVLNQSEVNIPNALQEDDDYSEEVMPASSEVQSDIMVEECTIEIAEADGASSQNWGA